MTRLLGVATLLCLLAGLLFPPSFPTDTLPDPPKDRSGGGWVLASPGQAIVEVQKQQGGKYLAHASEPRTPAYFSQAPLSIRLSRPGFEPLLIDKVEWGMTYRLQPGFDYLFRYRPLLCLVPILGVLTLLSRKRGQIDQRIEETQAAGVASTIDIGSQVGPYRLVRRLGQGATAEVFLGESQQRQVAVKILHANVSESTEFRTRFEREIGLSQKLDHPRIIKTYEWGLLESRYWMAQEFLPGSTLDTWVKPSGMHARDVRKILIQICEGLQQAHQHGVYHRDLKPENILLNGKGEPVIADFGMARGKMYATITHTEAILGTPAYMAPEQAQGHRVDGRADLYAVGVIAYELLTGRLPFVGEPLPVLIAQIQEEPVVPREYQPGIPAEYEELVLKLLKKDPDHRYQSAQELISALEAL